MGTQLKFQNTLHSTMSLVDGTKPETLNYLAHQIKLLSTKILILDRQEGYLYFARYQHSLKILL